MHAGGVEKYNNTVGQNDFAVVKKSCFSDKTAIL